MIEAFKIDANAISSGPNVTFDSTFYTEITCIVFHQSNQYIFAGHKNGTISGWAPKDNFLAMTDKNKIHDGVILILT